MKCSQCQRENSPPNARFCVACGYALLQPCPYGCGHEALPVRSENPVAQCPKCGRFTVFCPECRRLQTLGARDCPTARCQRGGVSPHEPFAACGPRAGGAPLALQSPWRNAKPRLLNQVQGQDSEQRCGGLASRYGQLVWWKQDKLLLWPAPTLAPTAEWRTDKWRLVEVIAPLFQGGLFPHREALLLAHGYAYLLGDKTVSRVPLGQEQTDDRGQTLLMRSSDSWGEAPVVDEHGWAIEAAPAPATLQAHEIEWLAQNETATRWLGLGEIGGELIGVTVRGSSAIFEGERWELPAPVTLNDWQELLVWNDEPVLLCERKVWRERERNWEPIFEMRDEAASLSGALAAGNWLWVWGQEAGRLWVERIGADGTRARGSMPFASDDRLDCSPVAQGARITFWVAGSRNGVATLNIERPLEDAHFQQTPASQVVLWTKAVEHAPSGQFWLVYAVDDGDVVRLQLIEQSPIAQPPLELTRFSPFRDAYGASAGATLAATISGDCLLISVFGTIGGQPVARLFAFSWK